MYPDLKDKVVVITGAVGNAGEAAARRFQQEGCRLALADRGADRLGQTFSDLVNSSDSLLVNSVDSNDAAAVESLMDQAIARFGQIDVLINPVGGYKGGLPVHQMEVDLWDSVFSLNARTAFIASRAAAARMVARGATGRIIHVSAKTGREGGKNSSAYSAAKSAVLRLTESMAQELKDLGITVNAILPSYIDTPSNRQSNPNADYSKWVTPESLASVMAFLASAEARDITGASLPVFGRA